MNAAGTACVAAVAAAVGMMPPTDVIVAVAAMEMLRMNFVVLQHYRMMLETNVPAAAVAVAAAAVGMEHPKIGRVCRAMHKSQRFEQQKRAFNAQLVILFVSSGRSSNNSNFSCPNFFFHFLNLTLKLPNGNIKF